MKLSFIPPAMFLRPRFLVALVVALPICESALAVTNTWTGSAGGTDWITAANWGGTAPVSGVATFLNFTSANASPSNTLTNTLTTSSFIIGNITFEAGAPSYTMTGNTFRLNANGVAGNGIINNSGTLQTFNTPIFLGNNATVSGASVTINSLTVFNASRVLTNNVSAGSSLTLGSVSLSDAVVAARTLTVSGSGNTLFSGTISNGSATAGSLTFNATHTGTATINAANTYTGATTLSAGSFVLGNDAAFGTGTLAVNGANISGSGARLLSNTTTLGGDNTFSGANNIEFNGTVTATGNRTISNVLSGGAVLTFSNTFALSSNAANNLVTLNGSGTTVISGVISSGTGGAATPSLAYSGTGGTLILSGNNTYTGTTAINAGTLLVQNTAGSATGSGPVTLADGATLGGDGTIAGNLTANGNLTPGTASDSTVTLNLNGNVSMSATTNTTFDIDGTGAGTFDVIANNGDSASFDGDLVFDLTGTYSAGDSWTVFSGFGSYGGTFDSVSLTGSYAGSLSLTGDLWSGTVGGLDFQFNEVTGVLSVVPEPSAFALLGIGLTALWWRSRFRKSGNAV